MIVLFLSFFNKLLLKLNNLFLLIANIFVSFLALKFIINSFNFSDNNIIKFLKNFKLKILFSYLFSFIYYLFLIPIIFCEENDEINLSNTNKSIIKDNNVTLSGNINLNKDSAIELSNGLVKAASNIGLGASIGGVAAAIGTAIKSAPLPPIQKAGLVIIGGSAGGAIHTAVTAIKKNAIESINTSNLNNKDIDNAPSPSDFYVSSVNEEFNFIGNSPLEDLLFSILTLNVINFILIFLLIFNLLNRFFLNKEPELKWIDSIISIRFRNHIRNLILKIIKSNKQISWIYIIIILILLIICQFSSVYFLSELCNNLERFCKGYLKYLLNR
jgi:hypothetical protein